MSNKEEMEEFFEAIDSCITEIAVATNLPSPLVRDAFFGPKAIENETIEMMNRKDEEQSND